jgi:Polyketide cyclase / dehydrase and lipid transport
MWEYEHTVETTATPDVLWRHWSDMPAWPEWNEGIEKIEINGPFEVGTTFTMTPPGDDPVTMQLTEITEGRSFTDVMDTGDFVVTTFHRLEQTPGGQTRVIYRTEISGPAADEIGPQIGPAITGDFPEVLAALVKLAES